MLGAELGLPRTCCGGSRSPGPGLAVRILGEVTAERCDVLRAADVDHRRGDPARRALRVDLAVVRRAAAGADRRRDGRRAHLRRHAGAARGALARRHDRRLGAAAVRSARARSRRASSTRCAASTASSTTSRRSPRRRSSGSSASATRRGAPRASSLPRWLWRWPAPRASGASRDADPLTSTQAGVTVDWMAGTLATGGGAAADLRMPSVDLARPGAERRARAVAEAKLRAALAALPLGGGQSLKGPENRSGPRPRAGSSTPSTSPTAAPSSASRFLSATGYPKTPVPQRRGGRPRRHARRSRHAPRRRPHRQDRWPRGPPGGGDLPGRPGAPGRQRAPGEGRARRSAGSRPPTPISRAEARARASC